MPEEQKRIYVTPDMTKTSRIGAHTQLKLLFSSLRVVEMSMHGVRLHKAQGHKQH